MSDKPVERQADGRWISPPKSPGRPVGPSRAERVAEALEPHLPEVLAKAVELAKLGDPAALRLVLERYAPAARPEDERVSVPGFASAPTLELKSAAVMSAIASGEVSAAAGQRLLQALEVHSRIVTTQELERRLEALEGRPRTVSMGTVIDACDLV